MAGGVALMGGGIALMADGGSGLGDDIGRLESAGSTGRTAPGGANEQRAMDLVKGNPEYGNRLPLTMRDPRWPAEDGWVKMEQTVDGVEVHYVYNTRTGAVDGSRSKTGVNDRAARLRGQSRQ
jgi:hypothetical protein